MDFTKRILEWYKINKRDLPWRETNDPYKIWLSEVILQQTRIAQGIHYYYKFLDLFPDVHSLAHATEDQILAAWQGLGYYSRARNLHTTAKTVVELYDGNFPESYQQLLGLKGIGPYTAAAIGSIAYRLPIAAIDGNVIRVLARYFGIEEPVDALPARKAIEEIAGDLLDSTNPGDFNQAMMDFGATICKPVAPQCIQCPLFEGCIARMEGKTTSIPVKSKKVLQKERYFHFFFIFRENDTSRFLVEKREADDIWKNLYQLPLIETKAPDLVTDSVLTTQLLSQHKDKNGNPISDVRRGFSTYGTEDINPDTNRARWVDLLTDYAQSGNIPCHARFTHQLTHQRIRASFYKVPLGKNDYSIFEKHFREVTFEEFEEMGKPILILNYIRKSI